MRILSRIAFTACLSFGWLMSSASIAGPPEQAEKEKGLRHVLEFRRAENEFVKDFVKLKLPRTEGKKEIYVAQKPDILPADIRLAELEDPELAPPQMVIRLQFTSEGQAKWRRLFKEHWGKPVAIFFRGKVVSVATIRGTQQPGSTGILVIVSVSKEEAQKIVQTLSKKK